MTEGGELNAQPAELKAAALPIELPSDSCMLRLFHQDVKAGKSWLLRLGPIANKFGDMS
jgi:hypothetical protein